MDTGFVAHDRRSHGRSDKTGGQHMDQYADDLVNDRQLASRTSL